MVAAILCLGLAWYGDFLIMHGDVASNLAPGDPAWWLWFTVGVLALIAFSYALAAVPGRRPSARLPTILMVVALSAAANLAFLYGNAAFMTDFNPYLLIAGACLVGGVWCARIWSLPDTQR